MATFKTEQIMQYGERLMEIQAEISKLALSEPCKEVHIIMYNNNTGDNILSRKWNALYNVMHQMTNSIYSNIHNIGYSIHKYAGDTIANEEEAAARLGGTVEEINDLANEFNQLGGAADIDAGEWVNDGFDTNSQFHPANDKYY